MDTESMFWNVFRCRKKLLCQKIIPLFSIFIHIYIFICICVCISRLFIFIYKSLIRSYYVCPCSPVLKGHDSFWIVVNIHLNSQIVLSNLSGGVYYIAMYQKKRLEKLFWEAILFVLNQMTEKIALNNIYQSTHRSIPCRIEFLKVF